ncbi:MAG: peptide-methionine (S)-S-oxide reductase MsrA [Acidimicrobiales bacterium]|jgi:peptide-methionine (S)-S-oxide reductase|nr:peptide-methionine (S)-S-oxide reductase MsrA [Acidimicrobiales bacterium]MDP6298093.1 peptide-methionine (S)-S-oxide reductase MsrA [Acidimicrobiales bacterium]HJM29385.1 peptide-methionine (S)-S-oxide reductase MsrA [Acidimicrobiales bacterium]HJM96823.1 peptide-methionine (S)-S-oxide reductase MsrA [Acidimicrobiales bacterium]
MRLEDPFSPQMPDQNSALSGRTTPMHISSEHFVLDSSQTSPSEDDLSFAMFGMGCFWGAERKFWEVPNIATTSVGYAGGYTPNPSYEEVCSGMTGHNEVVRVMFNSDKVSYDYLLKVFWENHNPTQGMRQGNDIGTQYRSGIYCYGEEQIQSAERSKVVFQSELERRGFSEITTEIIHAPVFYFAEDYHQQYLGKNPNGYCGLGGTGVTCLI